MTLTITPLTITHAFNADPSASGKVDNAELDTILGDIAAALALRDAVYSVSVKTDGALQDSSVHLSTLADDVTETLTGVADWIWKEVCRVASTANLSLTGAATVDGVALSTNDRVLVRAQTDPKANGIYLANTAGAWTRAADATTGADLYQAAVCVVYGTLFGNSQWLCNNATAPTIGTDDVTFAKIHSGTNVPASAAGAGISVSGGVIDVEVDDTTIEVNGSNQLQVKALGIAAAQLATDAVTTAKILAANVTNAKLANMAAATLKGSIAGGVPADLTAAQAAAILPAVIGDSGTGGTKGLVPAPAAGDTALKKFLSADGLWEAFPTTNSSAIPQNIAAEPATGHPFTTPGTYSFFVPADVVAIMAEVWGGGGGGASGSTTGQGGGGGGHAKAPIVTHPFETLTVVVGAGGASNTAGGASYLMRGATALLTGGAGDTGAISSGGGGTGAGGAGAKDATIPVAMLMNGQPGGGYTTNYGGPGGDSPRGGPGGPGAFSAGELNGTDGLAPGGGGGGGLHDNSPGGTGGNGMVMISY